MEFIACPEFLKFFNINPDTVDNILKSDFNCGFISALSIILFIFLLFLAIRILAFILFRTRRCNKIMVQSGSGTLIVTRKAIESVIRAELAAFSQITVRKLVLYRKGKTYSLKLCCQFASGSVGMPEITQQLTPRIKEVMNRLFGIDTMNKIDICIERLRADDDDAEEAVPENQDVDTGL
jgi:hypothetical protein